VGEPFRILEVVAEEEPEIRGSVAQNLSERFVEAWTTTPKVRQRDTTIFPPRDTTIFPQRDVTIFPQRDTTTFPSQCSSTTPSSLPLAQGTAKGSQQSSSINLLHELLPLRLDPQEPAQLSRIEFSGNQTVDESVHRRVGDVIDNLEENEDDDLEVIASPTRVADDVERLSDVFQTPGKSKAAKEMEKEQEEVYSPIKVAAEKDSQELLLNLDLDPGVQCTRLRVRVPLKKGLDGQSLPLSVSANYTNIKSPEKKGCSSPAKQTSILDFFNGNPGGGGMVGRVARKIVDRSFSSTSSLTSSVWEAIKKKADAKGFLQPPPPVLNQPPKIRGNQRGNSNWGKRTNCPWWKKLKDTTFAMDAFSHGIVPDISHYILSHFHSDHYIGLSKAWTKTIICSSITKRLAIDKFKVSENLFQLLDPGEERVIAGVEITAIDANHCPGSLIFVFRTKFNLTLLHTGDFRACAAMEEAPVFWNMKMDRVYLDTTYCKPEYDFPSQEDVIAKTILLVSEFVIRRPTTAVLVGAYTLGKERIFKAVAKELKSKLWTQPHRLRVWKKLEDQEILEKLVEKRDEAQVHVVDNRLISWGALGQEIEKVGKGFDHILGIKPTGWSHSRGESKESSLKNVKIVTRGQISILDVPYSEHSSYSELKRFIKFLRVKDVHQIVPTVNRKNVPKMEKMFASWIEERINEGPDSHSSPQPSS